MNKEELDGLRSMLKVLHALADAGVLEQVLGEDGLVRWKATEDSDKRLAALAKTLRD